MHSLQQNAVQVGDTVSYHIPIWGDVWSRTKLANKANLPFVSTRSWGTAKIDPCESQMLLYGSDLHQTQYHRVQLTVECVSIHRWSTEMIRYGWT